MSTAKKDIVPGTVVEVNFGPRNIRHPVLLTDKAPTKNAADAIPGPFVEPPIGDTLVILTEPIKINQRHEYYTREVIPSKRQKIVEYCPTVYVEVEWNGKLWYAGYGSIRYGTSVKTGIKHHIYWR